MFNFLHTYEPNPLLINIGPLRIFWYGVFIVTGILIAIFISLKLADKYHLNKDKIIDLIFWSIILSIMGARAYHVFLEFDYYLTHPVNIFKIWQGGLAIHGGIIAGIITIYLFSRKNNFNPWQITAIFAPGLALAQAIGRWGNYFNQELFGLPTNLPWGIPIEAANRVPAYYSYQYFHPTFLYESLLNIILFIFLINLHRKLENEHKFKIIVFSYLIGYSIIRFGLEFIRIDSTPEIFFLRWPQIVSLVIIAVSGYFLAKIKLKK